MTYLVTLPKDPTVEPTAFGDPLGAHPSTTWNFELRRTFWFGLTLCDTASAPEYTKTCKPDSDSNNLVGTNPNAPNYRVPGGAGQSTVLRSQHVGQLRQPARRRAVLSALHDRNTRRDVHVAGGRQLHPGHDRPLRWQLYDGVRRATASGVPRARIHNIGPDPGLQQRRSPQSLSGRVGIPLVEPWSRAHGRARDDDANIGACPPSHSPTSSCTPLSMPPRLAHRNYVSSFSACGWT